MDLHLIGCNLAKYTQIEIAKHETCG